MTQPKLYKSRSKFVEAIPLAQSDARGSLTYHIAHEFFSNSVHFPLANILLETLLTGQAVFSDTGTYVLLFGSLIQAWFLGMWEYQGMNRRFIGNLIGPTIYTLIALGIEGLGFFSSLNHLAYWGFSLLIGLFATLQIRCSGKVSDVFLVLENVARALILLGMYWIFEIAIEPEYASVVAFFSDGGHDFFAIGVVVFGILIGLEKVNSRQRMTQVADLNDRLGEYSEWLLGKELLSRALADPVSTLGLQRRNRHVLFMDIRGFTGWSADHSPELVVDMLNRYFSISEDVWQRFDAVKAKYTGDEVMAVFDKAGNATRAAQEFMENVSGLLSEIGLSVGIGIHSGPLIEGALGSERVKAYDVIGDTVNIAKRLCDRAESNEILITNSVLEALGKEGAPALDVVQSRTIQAKGNLQQIEVHALGKGHGG